MGSALLVPSATGSSSVQITIAGYGHGALVNDILACFRLSALIVLCPQGVRLGPADTSGLELINVQWRLGTLLALEGLIGLSGALGYWFRAQRR